MSAPSPVGDVGSFLERLRDAAGDGAVALGLDLPLGLPRGYAARRSEPDFTAFLRGLACRPQFFAVAEAIGQVSHDRPFYPRRNTVGMTRAAHAAALGLTDAAALARACDRATVSRHAGAPLFWTLGPQQVGKAALAAWRDLLLPGLAAPAPLRLWPFDGPFRALLAPGTFAVAETYPAEALCQLRLRLRGSKRRQSDRAALAAPLRTAMTDMGATPEPALDAALTDGFDADPAGEDRFDCVLGLLCLLGVLAGCHPDTAPPDPWVQRWEGWVLGQAAVRG